MAHGDIKSENILVTSWNWVYVSDFASYKPTFLPLDDPSDFSFFFDTSGRRSCYIAPERFYTASENPDISAKKSRLAMEDSEGKRDGKVVRTRSEMMGMGNGCVVHGGECCCCCGRLSLTVRVKRRTKRVMMIVTTILA